MKRFLSFAVIIAVFFIAAMYVMEKTDPLGFADADLAPTFNERDGARCLDWRPLPYPAYWRVDTYYELPPVTSKSPTKKDPINRLIKSEFTIAPSYRLSSTAVPTNYRLTAYGMFGEIAQSRKPIKDPRFDAPARPQIISNYDEKNPASLKPFLIWHTVPTAACYELEISDTPDHGKPLFTTKRIYTNGCQVNLTPFYSPEKSLYWHVRALDLDRRPLGLYSENQTIAVDPTKKPPDRPALNEYDRMHGQMPLYPVYHWIPLAYTAEGEDDYESYKKFSYEVELLDAPPPAEYENSPYPDALWHGTTNDLITIYDEDSRSKPGKTYYWRVRALDSGEQYGHYSDLASFTVPVYHTRPLAAAYGDSITHGGGAVSYSPANLEYSYTTYLDFPAINLGRSGDTVRTSLERFESDVLPLRPYNLLILTGTNNLRNAVSAAEMTDLIDELEKICEANDIRPIFLTLMPINTQNIEHAFNAATYEDWRTKMRTVNRHLRTKKYCIDLEPYFYDESGEYLAPELAIDGLHPDINGKMLMAQIINDNKKLLRK